MGYEIILTMPDCIDRPFSRTASNGHVSPKFPINLGPRGTHVDDKLALSTPDRDANLFRPTRSL